MKKVIKKVMLVWVLALYASSSFAQLNVVATTPSMGMLARAVGGSAVSVKELAPADRDFHTLQVKPSMMQAVRRADLLVSVGAELEIGWLPPVIAGAANPKVTVGSNGYFEAASQVKLIDKLAGNIGRSQGDVHPLGNPHLYFDPIRMGTVAVQLAKRMAVLAPADAATFTANASQLQNTLTNQTAAWQKQLQSKTAVLMYHGDADYLLNRMSVATLGLIEPMPGFPPTASHIQKMVAQYKGKTGRVFCMSYQMTPAINQLGTLLGWKVNVMPSDVKSNGSVQDYVQFINQWVVALSAG